MKTDYSEKEMKLFKYFGYDSPTLLDDNHISAPALYQMMVNKAFCNDMLGTEVNSLRKCYKALQSCSVYRMTTAWDDMIEFS
jgi:hypothetical protein